MDQDRYLICIHCATRFVWTGYEQAVEDSPPQSCPACRVLRPGAGRERGLVKFYNPSKGWGFIIRSDGPAVFVHRTGLRAGELHPLREGELVEFALEASHRGPKAIDLSRVVA